MSVFIKLECTAGTSIESASVDAQRVADMLGIAVEFNFNDVHCYVVPGGSAVALAEEQQKQQARKLSAPLDRRFASSRPRA